MRSAVRSAVLLAWLAACSLILPEAAAPPPVKRVPTAPAPIDPRPGAAGIGDRLYPSLGNGGYDVGAYRFELDLDPVAGEVVGVATIAATATQDLSSFNLDLVGLHVTRAEVEGKRAGFQREGRELVVEPVAPIRAGSVFETVISYRGIPGPVPQGPVSFSPGWQTSAGGWFLFSQPDGAAGLFPVNDHPADRADVDLQVTVPAPFEVVSSGTRIDSDRPDRWEFRLTDVAPYLIPLGVGRFELRTETHRDRDYSVWFSEGIDQRLLSGFDLQPEIITFYEDRFGPYPFESVGALVVDDELAAALETQTMPTYTTASLVMGEELVAHELAHQWFGDSIGVEQWDDIWLNEGFATFAQWLWLEEREGSDAYRQRVDDAYMMFAEDTAGLFPPPDSPPADGLFNPSVYLRGGLALAALREEVGDGRFFDLLRSYVDQKTGTTVTTEELVELVSEQTGPEAAKFLEQWLGEPDIPDP